jgi:ribosome-associated heat shock protein Hsp15
VNRLQEKTAREADSDLLESVRLDTWLDVACLFRTRSEAQKACKSGRIEVNGQPAKPHRVLRPGDRIDIARPFGGKQRIVVRALAERHLPRAEARTLYEDLTPPPTPEDIERRRADRVYRAAMAAAGAPDRRERRTLRKLRRKE